MENCAGQKRRGIIYRGKEKRKIEDKEGEG
jgi:hypothetical protein